MAADGSRCREPHPNIRQSLGNVRKKQRKNCRSQRILGHQENMAHRINQAETIGAQTEAAIMDFIN